MDNALRILSALNPLIVVALGWFVGLRLAAGWALRQKRRESVHSALATFQALYGRWFSLAKLWLVHLYDAEAASDTERSMRLAERRWDLIRQVVELEGEFESFWLKLAAQYNLSPQNRVTMERFREGFQVLRRETLAGAGLDWFATNNEQYRAFKTLAARIVSALGREDLVADRAQEEDTAVAAFHAVTSNRFQYNWFRTEDDAGTT